MEQDWKHLILTTESLENVYGCSDTQYGLENCMDDNFELIRYQQMFPGFTKRTCRPEIDFQLFKLNGSAEKLR
jgi:hypothetical protein